MTRTINGSAFRAMLESGARNLDSHRKEVNRINVFPVPDGDTGTNMVVTVRNALAAIAPDETSLSAIARKFSRAVVFGARGNSGVIASQFLSGMSERFFDVEEADAKAFSESLVAGSKRAYGAVVEPVEGTMLTVVREAADSVAGAISDKDSVEDTLSVFIESAKRSVERTPELLPVLREAGVVDSGGAGIVFFFEGVKRYFDGETDDGQSAAPDDEPVQLAPDVSAFDRNSIFEYGYCTEALIQTLAAKEPFSAERFRADLLELGESVAVSVEDGKVKVHVHTHFPERVLDYCHRYGEFLTLKIENMTVQNAAVSPASPYLAAHGPVAVVALAADGETQRLLGDMGADAVLRSDGGASKDDFAALYSALAAQGAKSAVVFPCGEDEGDGSVREAAGAAAKDAALKVLVANTKNFAECYAALAMVDFDETDAKRVKADADRAAKGITAVRIAAEGDAFVAYAGGKEFAREETSLADAALCAVKRFAPKCNSDVITLFGGRGVGEGTLGSLCAAIAETLPGFDVDSVKTGDPSFSLMISFE